MSPLQLVGETGTHEIPDSHLLVGLDETGHELFADTRHPVFGIGGCAVRVKQYGPKLLEPWRELRPRVFPDWVGALHAADVGQLPPERAEALGQFFTAAPFGRFAVVVSDRAQLEPDIPPYKVVARWVIDRIVRLLGRSGCDGIAMIMEESQRSDPMAAAFFEGYHIEVPRGSQRVRLPFLKFRMPKSAAEPLLEVADFVVHVAGCQVRDALKGHLWGQRRDFKAIFPPGYESDPRVEFLEILKAEWDAPRE